MLGVDYSRYSMASRLRLVGIEPVGEKSLYHDRSRSIEMGDRFEASICSCNKLDGEQGTMIGDGVNVFLLSMEPDPRL